MDYQKRQSYENLGRRMFSGVGEYGIPQISPETFEGECEFIGFNYARGKCSNPEEKAVISSWMTTSLTHYGEIQTDMLIS